MALRLADHLERSHTKPKVARTATTKNAIFILDLLRGSAVLIDGSDV
jgi:hypothetical protein